MILISGKKIDDEAESSESSSLFGDLKDFISGKQPAEFKEPANQSLAETNINLCDCAQKAEPTFPQQNKTLSNAPKWRRVVTNQI